MALTVALAARSLLRFLTVAFFLHWAWEALHAAAYVESAGPFLARARHCLPMAGVDALWTLGLVAAVGVVTGSWTSWTSPRICVLALAGAITAILLELQALSVGRWTYNSLMPLVPGLDVGLWPVLQMVVLPPATVLLAMGRTGTPRWRAS